MAAMKVLYTNPKRHFFARNILEMWVFIRKNLNRPNQFNLVDAVLDIGGGGGESEREIKGRRNYFGDEHNFP